MVGEVCGDDGDGTVRRGDLGGRGFVMAREENPDGPGLGLGGRLGRDWAGYEDRCLRDCVVYKHGYRYVLYCEGFI